MCALSLWHDDHFTTFRDLPRGLLQPNRSVVSQITTLGFLQGNNKDDAVYICSMATDSVAIFLEDIFAAMTCGHRSLP